VAHEGNKEKVVAMDQDAIQDVLASCSAFVTYVPLRTEADFASVCLLPEGVATYQIQPRAALDPAHEAAVAFAAMGAQKTCVLMPGRAFDAAGTRLGQGGGWYDRFLAQVPSGWLRIGFCFSDRFSIEALPRNSWDQPVDYVCVVDRATNAPTWYETGARV
jgi:hypothetical protein